MPDEVYRTPGQLIQDLLNQRGWSQRVLAIILRIDESGLNKIIAARRSVDATLALQLAEVFGVPAERFLDLQKRYDLEQARIIARPDPTRANRMVLFGDLPVTEMIKRGWLDARDIRDTATVEKALTAFFQVKTLDEIEVLPHAAKKTDVLGDPTPVQLAWLYRVREIATEMLVGKFSDASCLEAIERIKPLRLGPVEARKVPRILMECGIRFVVVESLPAAKIDGVCCWLNENEPVVGITFRFDRIDNFWFVLRHELEHVRRRHGGGKAILDTELEGERAGTSKVPEEEAEANTAAADFCVPRSRMDSFIARKEPFFAERDILGFAATLGVHPGLVAGQLQHRTGRYDRFRDHLVKIRAQVTPSAMTDGWGDVMPVGI